MNFEGQFHVSDAMLWANSLALNLAQWIQPNSHFHFIYFITIYLSLRKIIINWRHNEKERETEKQNWDFLFSIFFFFFGIWWESFWWISQRQHSVHRMKSLKIQLNSCRFHHIKSHLLLLFFFFRSFQKREHSILLMFNGCLCLRLRWSLHISLFFIMNSDMRCVSASSNQRNKEKPRGKNRRDHHKLLSFPCNVRCSLEAERLPKHDSFAIFIWRIFNCKYDKRVNSHRRRWWIFFCSE